jgi:hypothetical protein
MFWYPYTGAASLSLAWPSDIACTSLSLAALICVARLVLMVLQPSRTRAVVPHTSTPLDEEQEVKQAAA